MLKDTFINLLTNYTDDISLTNSLWTEIEQNYTDKKRYYHDLSHLNNVLIQLCEVKNKIENWNTVLFTLFYHDIIYNPLKSDNEEKSAELAKKRMKQINAPTGIIENCQSQILATKQHLAHSDPDTNYFTDADLSILGQEPEIYKTYFQNVRKEYPMYPNLIYNPGRKKVLKRFLEMDRIYKTAHFYAKFEKQAKSNFQYELEYI